MRNREGQRVIDAAMEGNKEDLGRLLGRANIGESWSLLQNIDYACIINPEYSNLYKQWFLTFKRIKIRYKCEDPEFTYFNHPFDVNNRMYLLDDLEGECVSKISLSSQVEHEELASNNSKNAIKRPQLKADENNSIINVDDFEAYLSSKVS